MNTIPDGHSVSIAGAGAGTGAASTGKVPPRTRPIRPWVFATVLVVLCGCARIRQYSIESYQGPLPMEDYQTVNGDRETNPASIGMMPPSVDVQGDSGSPPQL